MTTLTSCAIIQAFAVAALVLSHLIFCRAAREARKPQCDHSWKTVEVIRVFCEGKIIGWDYVLRCEKCGEIKPVRV